MNKTIKPILNVIYTLSITGVLLIWLMQDSINAYWTQTYHQQSPLTKLSAYKEWQLGSDIHQKLENEINEPRWQILDNKLSAFLTPTEKTKEIEQDKDKVLVAKKDNTITKTQSSTTTQTSISRSPVWHHKNIWTAWKQLSVCETFVKTNKPQQITVTSPKRSSAPIPIAYIPKEKVANKQVQKNKEKPQVAKVEKNKAAKSAPESVTINKKQMVFYAGDSMMQGVAPHVKSALYKKYKIKGIDLSKQSTGLTYSSFFNWPKTVKQTLKKHKNIGLMVMFLGPNDPWNMPNPKGGKYLKFQSAAWENVYRNKIRQIIDLAKKHQVQIIWLGVPDMRKKKLNKGVRYLNTLYQSEVKKAGGIYLPTQFLLAGKESGYSKYAMSKTHKKVAVRTNDGIHFTVAGQKKIARQILAKITIKED